MFRRREHAQSIHIVAEPRGWSPRAISCPRVDIVSRDRSLLGITASHAGPRQDGEDTTACARRAWPRNKGKCSKRYNNSKLQRKQEKRKPKKPPSLSTLILNKPPMWNLSTKLYHASHQAVCDSEIYVEEIGPTDRLEFAVEVVVDVLTHQQEFPQCVMRLNMWDTGAGH